MDVGEYQLNEYQKKAVLDENQYAIVKAQVGSGKTTVLISKIFHLYKNLNVSFEDMVVLTFTNKASNEIKERIKKFDNTIEESSMNLFGTFHSVALKLLRDILKVEELEYKTDFTVIDPDEVMELALQIISDNKLDIKYKKHLDKRLDQLKNGEVLYSAMKNNDDIESLAELLKEEKVKINKMDFDDLLENANTLLSKNTYKAKYIIVDEFQDCNEAQLNFIKGLSDEKTNIFVVGDPNQLIYSWRGSRLNVFDEFKKEYNATELSLPINYRSQTIILDAAKKFLGNNEPLEGIRDYGDKIIIKNHYNPFNEAQYLADKIKELKGRNIDYNDIAILYRTQKQAEILENTFRKSNIPFQVSMKKSLKDIPVLYWVMRVLRSAVNPEDKGNLLLALTDERYGERLTKAQVKKLLKNKDDGSCELKNLICRFREYYKVGNCDNNEIDKSLYNYFNLDKYLMITSASFESDKKYVEDFFTAIKEYMIFNNLEVYEGLIQFLNSSTLYGLEILKDDIHASNSSVKLMTLHACKGLEFKYVFIIGVNYGLLPLLKSSDEMAEEKRLFFVGITRAKDNLELSFCTNPEQPRVLGEPSQYIYLIPEELVQPEEKYTPKADFKNIARQVKAIMEEKNNEVEVVEEVQKEEKRVEHDKYGKGVVAREDEEFITVEFERYGEKIFTKMFVSLRIL
jgi:DNA helicase II / ATP-dependent DNA helicase PcrA